MSVQPQISTSAELVLLNTTTNAGTIRLPSTNIVGRILTFKDIQGTFNQRGITFTTINPTQLFENNTSNFFASNQFGSYTFATGTDNKWYTIGGSFMDTASISSITSISMNMIAASTATVTTSTLSFEDTVTNSTNQVFLRSTLLYYSSPVTGSIFGGTRAPRPLFLPMPRPFLPNQIAGLAFWYDSADSNTLILRGNTVQSWRDKSGRGNVATIAAGTVTYNQFNLNGLPFLTFGAASQMNMVNPTYASGTRSLFAVLNVGAPGSLYAYLAGGTANATVLLYSDAITPASLEYNKSGTQLLQARPPTNFFNKTSIVSATNVSNELLVDGTIAANPLTINSPSAFATGSAQEYLGQGLIGTPTAAFNMAEIMVYDATLSLPFQRQQVEGYLAWKWGLVAQLPSTHPYKLTPP